MSRRLRVMRGLRVEVAVRGAHKLPEDLHLLPKTTKTKGGNLRSEALQAEGDFLEIQFRNLEGKKESFI